MEEISINPDELSHIQVVSPNEKVIPLPQDSQRNNVVQEGLIDWQRLKDIRNKISEVIAGRFSAHSLSREEMEGVKIELGDVKELAETYNAYFVHGIRLNAGGWQNYSIEKGHEFGWQEKIYVTLLTKPTTSSSSVQIGRTPKTWTKFGVLYGSGIIEQAHKDDQQSIGLDPNTRVSRINAPKNRVQYQQQLDEAITHHISGNGGWNEIIIGGNPDVVGLFLNDADPSTGRMDDYFSRFGVSYSDIDAFSQSLQLPVFQFDDQGHIYRTRFDKDRNRFISHEYIPPKEIVNLTYQIPDTCINKVVEANLLYVKKSNSV